MAGLVLRHMAVALLLIVPIGAATFIVVESISESAGLAAIAAFVVLLALYAAEIWFLARRARR